MRRVIPPSPQSLKILQLIVRYGKLTGTDICSKDESLPRGTLYTTLVRLERQKLLKSHKAKTCRRAGSPHRYFQITRRGARMVEAAVAGNAPIDVEIGRAALLAPSR